MAKTEPNDGQDVDAVMAEIGLRTLALHHDGLTEEDGDDRITRALGNMGPEQREDLADLLIGTLAAREVLDLALGDGMLDREEADTLHGIVRELADDSLAIIKALVPEGRPA